MFADGRVEDRPAICPKFGPKSISDIICMLLGLSPEEEKEKAKKEVKDILSMGVPAQKAEIQEKISEALSVSALAEYPLANITHFGDNRLVKNFFWYRVNN